MPDLRWRNFVLVVRRALSTPLSISLLGIGVLFALVMHSVPGLAILGGTIAVVMLYALAKVHDESFMRATIQEALDHEHKTELTNRVFRIEELDPECRVKMKTIARLFSEIAEDVANSPIDAAATGLTEMVKQAESLLERGLRMAQKRRDLMHYLTETDSQAIEMRKSGHTIKFGTGKRPGKKIPTRKVVGFQAAGTGRLPRHRTGVIASPGSVGQYRVFVLRTKSEARSHKVHEHRRMDGG